MSPNTWLIICLCCTVGVAVSTFMLKRAEKLKGEDNYKKLQESHKKLAGGQEKLAGGQKRIQTVTQDTHSIVKEIKHFLIRTDQAPSQEWIKIDFLNATQAKVPCQTSDTLFLQFEASSGIISGNIKIEGSDKSYPFSTHVNFDSPLPVKNVFLKEKGHYTTYPNFYYQILDKTVEKSELTIILVGVNPEGRLLKLEKPIGIKK